MGRREGQPVWIDANGEAATALQRMDLGKPKSAGGYDESWIQSLIHQHPNVLPVSQIEPAFGPIVSVCRELPLTFGTRKSGSLDNLFITNSGGILIVETKLWRNPEARRTAVAQAMEYAAAVFAMDDSALDRAIRRARRAANEPDRSLVQIAQDAWPDVDESEFIDTVSLNLQKGRAVVAVVGDGIREDVISIAQLLQGQVGHRFTFALVELAVYVSNSQTGRLIVPSVLAQTVMIERGVVDIADSSYRGASTIASAAAGTGSSSGQRRTTIGEDQYYESLAQTNVMWAESLKSFVAQAEQMGIYADVQGGLNLKHASPSGPPLNVASINRKGNIDTEPSTWWERAPFAQAYNRTLRELFGGQLKTLKPGGPEVLRNNEGRMPCIGDLLPEHEKAWLEAIDRYIHDVTTAHGES